jgi:hypothetical protein
MIAIPERSEAALVEQGFAAVARSSEYWLGGICRAVTVTRTTLDRWRERVALPFHRSVDGREPHTVDARWARLR